jgi:MFS family permease
VAARVVGAFAASSTEGLASAINADLFFLHERGKWMGIYIVGLNFGPVLGSLISGFVVQSLGWRWHLWVCSLSLEYNSLSFALSSPVLTLSPSFFCSRKRSIIAQIMPILNQE